VTPACGGGGSGGGGSNRGFVSGVSPFYVLAPYTTAEKLEIRSGIEQRSPGSRHAHMPFKTNGKKRGKVLCSGANAKVGIIALEQ